MEAKECTTYMLNCVFKLGIKEVVEWINSHLFYVHEDWKEQCQEWGIKEEME